MPTKTFFILLSSILLQLNIEAQISGLTVFDFNGNEYESVVLNNGQEWLTSNLRASTFNDGTPLEFVTDNEEWSTTPNPSYCFYQNNPSTSQPYGNLYNFFVASSDKNICPTGWRVPAELDWTILTNELGGLGLSGGKLKLEGVEFWSSPNTDATNEIRFDALPNGCRYDGGFFNNLNYYSFLWTSSELDTTYAWFRSLKYDNGTVIRNFSKKQSGYGIRCMRDVTSGINELDTESIYVYPNPTNGLIKFHLPNAEANEFTYSLFDNSGRLLEQGNLKNQTIDLTDYQTGNYLIRINNLKNNYIFNLHKLY